MAESIRRKIFWGMTEEEIRREVAQTACSLEGIREGTKLYEEKIRGVYNGIRPLPVGYKLTKTDPWCAAFVSVVGIMLEISDVILPECGCGRMIDLYKKQGRFIEEDGWMPRVGDMLFYDWYDDGTGDCTGAADHVGMVVALEGEVFRIIEGNYDNMVKIRTVRRDQHRIRGWAAPAYELLVHGYQDVPADAWYRSAVEWAEGLGIVEGIGDHDFAPKLCCSRSHAVTMLWRLAGEPGAGGEHPFCDVAADAYYAEAVAWAHREGITEGIAKDTFDPYAFCTRAQIAAMLWRWKGRKQPKTADHPFEDVQGGSWYADAVEWAWCEGITLGIAEREFKPYDACTRAQVVTMLHRMTMKTD